MSKLIVESWEQSRAATAADKLRDAINDGIAGAESMPGALPTGVVYPALADPEIRRMVYALFGALGNIEPWYTQVDFQNNWATLAGGFNHDTGVQLDPFARVSWRGVITRTSGVAVNGETICTFPAKYTPKKLLGYPCITNAGIIHIGVFNDVVGGLGRLVWRTTGGFTGGYAYVYLGNIGSYDTRD